MKKLKKNDSVIIISGKDRGRTGVLKTILKDKSMVIVQGIKLVKKNIKSNPNKQIEGAIIEKETPIHISNVAIYNKLERRVDRVVFRSIKGFDKKKRCFKSSNERINF
jgi:large subunit ribosomal protein L24